MYPTNDPRFLWVSASRETPGDGSFQNPFDGIASALAKVEPGQTVVLLPGEYIGDITVQTSGSMEKPIRIAVQQEGTAIIKDACWYLYDVSDMIISGLTFKDSPLGSIAVMGECERNKFEFLHFINCCAKEQAASTMFFGGSGAQCNVVENCLFARNTSATRIKEKAENLAVGLMISEGDTQQGKPILNHIISKNTFKNYDYGILVGSDDNTDRLYGHQISYNSVHNCTFEGIMVKCGDTLVKGNTISNCPTHAVSIVTGIGSLLEDNRIQNCGIGVRIGGLGHSVSNNCIINPSHEAVLILNRSGSQGPKTQNVIVESNTFVSMHKEKAIISIEENTCAIIQHNLFAGSDKPYEIKNAQHNNKTSPQCNCIVDNIAAIRLNTAVEGVASMPVEFSDRMQNDFGNNSGYGAQGWILSPYPFDPDEAEAQNSSSCNCNDENHPHSDQCDCHGH